MKDKIYNLFSFISEYALYGLLFFFPISNALVEIFVVLVFLSFAGRKIIKPDFKFLKFRPNIFLLFLLLFSALSLLHSGAYLKQSLHALFGKWTQYLGICIVIQDNIYDQKIVRRGMCIFIFSAFLAVFSGLSQYFLGFEFLRNNSIVNTDGGIRAITSSFPHYNSLGAYLTVVLPLLIALLLENNLSILKTWSLLIFVIFSTVTLIFTFSRGSWIAFVASSIFILILSKKHLKRIIPVFFVIIMFIFLYHPLCERLLFTFKSGGDTNRFKYWAVALKMIKEAPFLGMGVGTFMANFSKLSPGLSPAYAHNCYLQICAETGIFSLISFILFVFSVIYLGVKRFLASRDPLLLGLLAGTTGSLVHSFFDTNLYSLRLAILFWLWAGLIITRLRRVI